MDKNLIREIINEKLNSLEAEIADLKLSAKPIEPENSIGRISRMDAINNKTIVDRMLRNSEEKLKKLKYSLSIIDTEAFGNCRTCKMEINLDRLKLMPETSKCVKCS